MYGKVKKKHQITNTKYNGFEKMKTKYTSLNDSSANEIFV